MKSFRRHIPLLPVTGVAFALLLATLPMHEITPAPGPQLVESHIYCPICLTHYEFEPEIDTLSLVCQLTSEITTAARQGLPPINFLFENNNRAPPEFI